MKKPIIIAVAVAIVLCVTAGRIYQVKRELFLLRYLEPEAVSSLLKWGSYYGMSRIWLQNFSLSMTESNGDRKAKSGKDCHGYMMLHTQTAKYLRERLARHISDCNIYATEFNIAGGLLHIRSLLDRSAFGHYPTMIEMYNVGASGYQRGKRAPVHVKRFNINYTYYKTEWNKYLWGFGI